MSDAPENVTILLEQFRSGDREAFDRLMPLVYAELRRIAARYLRGERENHTLQPTALVNEAYMRMVDQQNVQWQNRAHFLGCAAQVMRHILVDSARAYRAGKRGGGKAAVTFEAALAIPEQRDLDLVALDDALNGLEAINPQLARVVELRYFGGLSVEETAEVVGVSEATVKRHWVMAKAWLFREMRRDGSA